MKKLSAPSEASPYKSVAEELERLRKSFRLLSQRYAVRMEAEIGELHDLVLAADPASAQGALPDGADSARPDGGVPAASKPANKPAAGVSERQASQFHDLRDMLTLLRTFEISSGVAKRRDFKRVENVLEELRLLARQWA